MLEMVRSKFLSKKLNRSTATTLKSCNSILSNPEIENLVEKLNEMTEEFPDNWTNPLNLVNWGKTKYCPSESENRIRIQNHIWLKKACHEKVRPKIKPIKRVSHSVNSSPKESSITYKDHYQKLKDQYNWRASDEADSEEEHPTVEVAAKTTTGSFRFQESVRKYKRITSYIEERMEEKKYQREQREQREHQTQKKKRTFYSQKTFQVGSQREQTPRKRVEKATKSSAFVDEVSILKIDSIVKKWKPVSKIEKKFASTDLKRQPRKRYSLIAMRPSVELPIETPRYSPHTSISSPGRRSSGRR